MKWFYTDTLGKGRVEAFSDGVFAIIITLLVLELRVPAVAEKELVRALLELWPKFLSWVISFLMVGVFWVNHHRFFGRIRTIDNGLLWLNMLFLLFVSFIPFPTALMGGYPNNKLAVMSFGVIMFLASLTFYGMRFYITRREELLNEQYALRMQGKLSKKYFIFGPLLYLVAIASGFIHPSVPFFLYIAIPLFFILPLEKEEDEQKRILW